MRKSFYVLLYFALMLNVYSEELHIQLQKTIDKILMEEALANKELSKENQNLLPGITVAITFKDSRAAIRLAGGFADIEKKIPMLATTRMLSGSTGKAFAGALATTFILENRLNLDEKISRFIDHESWYVKLPNKDTITVRHILNHSSGLTSYYTKPEFFELSHQWTDISKLNHNPDAYFTFSQLMDFATISPPLFPSGTSLSYSENGYLLVGYVVGRISTKSTNEEDICKAFFEQLQQRILTPLDLKETEPNIGRKFNHLAQGYIGNHPAITSYKKTLDDSGLLRYNPGGEFSGGGLVTSSYDLANFMLKAVEGKMYKEKEKADQFTKLLLTPSPLKKDVPVEMFYGLGPVVIKTEEFGTIIGHSGIIPGYLSQVFYFRDLGFSIAIQVNSSQNHHLMTYIKKIADAVLKYEHEK